jgi:ABC-type polysaccharide/polyol phosphate transport system ATPase subunit/predicted dehydrogenase
MSVAVRLTDVTKRFRAQRVRTGVKDALLSPRSWLRPGPAHEIVALAGVSLELARGETLGVIGRNGAGKSTLFSIVAGILPATSGRVEVHGRVSPLLGLGIGFSQELSGRKNAILNGVLLGLRREEIEAALPEIVEFSGLGDFIDQPLKTYSSGMQMRLGFSVAIHAEPELLLVDEVLAVGDAEFNARCIERIRALRAAGTTILLASHNLVSIESMCDRAICLEAGRVAAEGTPREVLARYRDLLDARAGAKTATPRARRGASRAHVGLVGCGRWGRFVLRDLVALGCDVSVVAPTEASRRNAEAGGAREIVAHAKDLPAVEGLVVATPSTTHAEVVEELLDRELPMFVEKPLTTDVESARRLVARAGERLFVMDKWRYHPGVLRLAELAREGAVGRVEGLRAIRQQWGNAHEDADASWILAPHDLAIALEVLRHIPAPRSAHAELHDGRVTSLVALLGDAPWLRLDLSSRHPTHRRELHLHGSEGVASLSDAYAEHVSLRRDASGDVPERLPLSREMPLEAELAAFLAFLAGGPPPRSSAAEGLAVVETIAALRGLAGVPGSGGGALSAR